MLKKNTKSLLIIVSILIIVNIIILSILSLVSWTYLTGFLIGSIISILSSTFDVLFVGQLLSKKRTKNIAFIISILRFLVWMLVIFGIIIGTLFINYFYNNRVNQPKLWIDGVFNIFFLIYGVTLIPISIFVNELFIHIKKKKWKEQE